MVDIFAEHNLVPENILSYSNISKEALGKVSGAVVDKVASGDEDPLEVYIKAKAVAEVANNIIKDVKALATDEAEKYDKAEAKMLGCEFMVKSGSTSYSFDHDEEWNNISDEIKALVEKRKEREKKMIDATNYAELIDDKTGEVVPPAEIKKSGGQILTITIPK